MVARTSRSCCNGAMTEADRTIVAPTVIEAAIEAVSGVRGGQLATDDATLAELGVTSILVYPLATEIERRIGRTFEDADFAPENFHTFGALRLLVERYL